LPWTEKNAFLEKSPVFVIITFKSESPPHFVHSAEELVEWKVIGEDREGNGRKNATRRRNMTMNSGLN
jgi:hypothetical protein